jgi:hypothetical protein
LSAREIQITNNKIAKQRAANQKEREELKYQLDNKLISQEQYDAKIKKLDADSEKAERAARKKNAESEKSNAVFIATLKAGLAWLETYLNPTKIPQAILATAQAAILSATPVPEFYDGGWMPRSSSDRTAIPIMAHANEYMINAQSARDPYVLNTIRVVETAKRSGVSPSAVVNNASLPAIKDTVGLNDDVKQLLYSVI